MAVALDKNAETFIVYIVALETMSIHPTQKARIMLLFINKTPAVILG